MAVCRLPPGSLLCRTAATRASEPTSQEIKIPVIVLINIPVVTDHRLFENPDILMYNHVTHGHQYRYEPFGFRIADRRSCCLITTGTVPLILRIQSIL